MQTFLPYASFKRSAQVLDRQRLGKQRSECRIIDNALSGKINPKTGNPYGWQHHLATKMWVGHRQALRLYWHCINCEWVARGYKHNAKWPLVVGRVIMPSWLGVTEFHDNHKSALYHKAPSLYPTFATSKRFTEYFWPTQHGY